MSLFELLKFFTVCSLTINGLLNVHVVFRNVTIVSGSNIDLEILQKCSTDRAWC